MENYSFMKSFHIDTPVRLIELFAGIGSQAMALKELDVDFEHYRAVEIDRFAMASYNAIHGTDFKTTDITQIHSDDLGITDTDKYTYILTYSFPCTDLSVAGQMAGMKENSNTRSSLLWEVKRLLNECDNLPQVLLMENVVQVHGKKNMPDFQKWLDFLVGKGYRTCWKYLHAADYGIPQSRRRCFAVSVLKDVLGDSVYHFPSPLALDTTMNDYLEDDVEDKYYLTLDKARTLIEQMIADNKLPLRGGQSGIDCYNLGSNNEKRIPRAKQSDIAQALTTKSCIYNYDSNGVVKCEKL